MSFPTAILFDLDDTILWSYRNPRAAWDDILGEQGLDLDPYTAAALGRQIAEETTRFRNTPERRVSWRLHPHESRRAVVRAAFARLRLDDQLAADRIADRYETYRQERMHLLPDALLVLDHLRAQGVRLALVTNGGGGAQREKIARFALGQRFDHVQIEGEAGYGKPDRRAFLDAMRALDVGADDAWMVGDDLEADVVAARELGIFSIWHDVEQTGLPPDAPARPDRIIVSLRELIE